jgi:hypothetical protein
MSLSQQPLPTAAPKRSCLSSPDLEPQPLPARALPTTLWADHLLPLLTCKDAARLECTCKALRGVVRDHYRAGLGTIDVERLENALTTFPRARSVELDGSDESGGAAVQWLREGGQGRHLERVTCTQSHDHDGFPSSHVHEALRQGALPSLKYVAAHLDSPDERAFLTEGLVASLRELQVTVESDPHKYAESLKPQLAALGLVRQRPALTRLDFVLRDSVRVRDSVPVPVSWPPFIPPSLKALRIELWDMGPSTASLVRALPGMLEASGARLDRLEVLVPSESDIGEDGLVHLTEALRCCSPTLKGFLLGGSNIHFPLPGEAQDVQWSNVLAGVSRCRELQVLVLPAYIDVEPLFPPGTAFSRLTHLDICDHEREDPPGAGVMGLWELMASGGLPALTKLSVTLNGRWGGVEEVRTRVAPALEAAAGTLTHLHLAKVWFRPSKWLSDEVDMGYEWGVAVGKLRRLKELALCLSLDGLFYQAMAQGLAAASEWERPLPMLWRVITRWLTANADLVASLLLPSVRVFISCPSDDQVNATAFGLRQAGYKHTWCVQRYSQRLIDPRALQSIALCRFVVGLPDSYRSPWTVSRGDGLPDIK